MADKYNVVEPKVSIGIVVSIVAFIAVALILILVAIPSNSERIYAAYADTANEYFTEDHPFYEINGSKVERMVDKEETFLLLISSSDCTACQSLIGTLERYFQDPEKVATVDGVKINELFDEIYYLSPLDDPSGYADVIQNIDALVDATPQLVLFMNGEIVETYNTGGTDTQTINAYVRDFYEAVITAVSEVE